MAAERLQKIIAAGGITSRRKAEELITAGRVSVNGAVVRELGAKADPERDQVRVDGRLVRLPQHHVYLMLNKPRGCVTTVTDPEGRPTVMKLVEGLRERVYPVGRLDYDSEGLLLLTNDGDLAYRLMHASSHVPKTYLVKVSGRPRDEELKKLRAGVILRPGPARPGERQKQKTVKTAPTEIRPAREGENPWYEVTLIEGRNRQIRRMFEQIGHHVEKIKRVRYGPLQLNVMPGKFRPLTAGEVASLQRAVSRQSRPEHPK